MHVFIFFIQMIPVKVTPESCKSIPDADFLVLDGHNNVPGQNPCLDYMYANHKINYYIGDTI